MKYWEIPSTFFVESTERKNMDYNYKVDVKPKGITLRDETETMEFLELFGYKNPVWLGDSYYGVDTLGHELPSVTMVANTSSLKTIVVNAFAGPGAGKTTSAWEISSQLKKKGVVVEYVPEYAKELVWDGEIELLNGSYSSETKIYEEKKRRIDRLIGKVEVIVTDSPLLQSLEFLDHDKVSASEKKMFENRVMKDVSEYENFNYFVERNENEAYEKAGRIHTLKESKELDAKIKAMLKNKGIYYGTYNHNTINRIADNIITTKEKNMKKIILEHEENMRQDTSPLDVKLEVDTDEKKSKRRLYVDIDGTLAVFKEVDTLEKLYEPGYFRDLAPQWQVLEAIRDIINTRPDIEVYSLSAVLADSKYALAEKNEWLDKYLPEITKERRLYTPCGEDKAKYIEGLCQSDYLLDDYTSNLQAWEPPAKGIKVLNGINNTKGTWQGEKIEIWSVNHERLSGNHIANGILRVMKKNELALKSDIGSHNLASDVKKSNRSSGKGAR
ncbi:hypothetical protein M2145_002541 [Lachnospiraceae bacterium PF1-21]